MSVKHLNNLEADLINHWEFRFYAIERWQIELSDPDYLLLKRTQAILLNQIRARLLQLYVKQARLFGFRISL